MRAQANLLCFVADLGVGIELGDEVPRLTPMAASAALTGQFSRQVIVTPWEVVLGRSEYHCCVVPDDRRLRPRAAEELHPDVRNGRRRRELDSEETRAWVVPVFR